MSHSSRIIELLLFSLLTLLFIEYSSQQECSASAARKIDGIMARLLTVGNSGRKFPESKGEELKKFCDDSKTYIQQVEDYKNKCLNGRSKQVTAIIVYSVKHTITQLCKRNSKRLDELIEAAPCMNKNFNRINRCYVKFIDTLLGAQNAVDDKKIPHYCCGYYRLFPCFESEAKKASGCSDKQVDLGINFVRSLFGSSVNLSCGEFNEGSDRCERLEPVPKKKKDQRRTKSFILPLVDLLAGFGEA